MVTVFKTFHRFSCWVSFISSLCRGVQRNRGTRLGQVCWGEEKGRGGVPFSSQVRSLDRKLKDHSKISYNFISIISSLPQSLCPCFEFCSNCWFCLKLLRRFVKINLWISLTCYMDLSKYMDFSEMLPGFVKVVYIFLALSQTKPSWSLIKISKLFAASVLN